MTFLVVPANAGTHTPRPLCCAQPVDGFLTAGTVGYGSLRSQGRREMRVSRY